MTARPRGVAPAVALLPVDALPPKPVAGSVAPQAPPPAEPALERLLTSADVGELLGLSERSLRRHARSGVLPIVKFGRSVRYHPSDLRKYLGLSNRETEQFSYVQAAPQHRI